MTDLAWETLDSTVAYTCDGFDVVSQDVELPDGTTTDFDYVHEPGSVVILPFTPDGDVVVIDEWRQAVGRVNRGLPAGNVEDGEPPADAAHRELTEETGYAAASVAHMTTVEPANGFADAVFHYFVARGCEPTADQSLDDDESITVATTTVADLLAAARDDDLRDGRAAFAVCYYALFDDETGSPSPE